MVATPRRRNSGFRVYFSAPAAVRLASIHHAVIEAPERYAGRFPDLTGTRRTYAGMLAATDDAVGRVLSKVRDLGQEENTLVFFYGDNGGPTLQTTSRNDPLRGYKGQFYEGGIRVPFLAQWKGKLPAGMVYREMVMGFDCHATALAGAGAWFYRTATPRTK